MKGNLKIHKETVHMGIKKYVCPVCDFTASRKGNLTLHLQSLHLGMRYKCGECDHKATSKQYLRTHQQSYSYSLLTLEFNINVKIAVLK